MSYPQISNPLRWLGGKFDVKVQIATGVEGVGLWDVGEWDSALWAPDDLEFANVTQYLDRLTVRGGQEKWDSRFTAGTATFVFDNSAGIFSPDSGALMGAVPLRPGRLIRIVVFPDPDDPDPEAYVPLFTGTIDSLIDHYDEGTQLATTVLTAIDALGDLQDFNPPALEVATGAGLRTDERVTTVLDLMGWPEELRNIEEGSHTMETSFLAQSALEECQRAAEAEGSALFSMGDGTVAFRNRDWLTEPFSRSTEVQGYIGFGGDLPDEYDGQPTAEIADKIIKPWMRQLVRNDIQFARSGGTLQRVQDLESQALYKHRSYSRRDFNCNTDAEVLFLAERNLAAYRDARPRLEPITIVANDDPDNEDLNRLWYDLTYGDLLSVKVKYQPRLYHVIGIMDEISGEEWRRTLTLDDSLTEIA